MKLPKLTWIGIIGGIGFSISSYVRYNVIYPDLDRGIVYFIVGILIAGLSYAYFRIRNLENKLDAVEEYIQDLNYDKEDIA